MVWREVLRCVVYWLDVGDVSRLWESEAALPRFVRSWMADRRRCHVEWAHHGYNWDDGSTETGPNSRKYTLQSTRKIAGQGGAHWRRSDRSVSRAPEEPRCKDMANVRGDAAWSTALEARKNKRVTSARPYSMGVAWACAAKA